MAILTRSLRMLIHPNFDPVALALGPISIRWYGLMYLAAFAQFWWLAKHRIGSGLAKRWTVTELDDLLFYGVLGVVLGGRLGQVVFYELDYYVQHPLEVLAIWKGGMSFHGGLLGVLTALWLHGKKHGKSFLEVGDFVAPLIPLGLAFGRLGNFINGELWGRPADPSLPWAMIFPYVDEVPRHPSQIYQAGLEGVLLFVILWWYSRRPRPIGAVSGLFLIGYGALRFVAEYFRSPDHGLFGQSTVVSMGQWLSLPMIVLGLWLYYTHTREKTA